ncbi:MAG: hypothetical protein K8S98_13205 [Planctomycetes bacterium]|nr:hypothetical protein [Planctomycetota bacterium]
MILQAAATLIVLAPLGLAQTTWYVDVHGTAPGTGTLVDPYTSIQYAVSRPTTLFNDVVLVAPGTYVENLSLTKDVRVKSSAGPLLTTICPAAPGRTVYISGSTTVPAIEGFTVTPGANPTVGIGAAVFMQDGAIKGCIVHDPFLIGTVAVVVDGTSTVSECTITANSLGIMVSTFGGDLWLRNSIVTGNQGDVSFGGNALVTIQYSAGIAGFDPNAYGNGNLVGSVGFWDAAHGELRSAYCTSKVNSKGCSPTIGWSGTASASSASPFVITATNELNNKSGIFFYGYTEDIKAFQGGWHCVKLPTKRTNVQNSGGNPPPNDCSGSYSFDFNALIQSGTNPALTPGRMIFAQYWARDLGAVSQSSFSDALRFGIGL